MSKAKDRLSLDSLAEGLEFNVYQSQNGTWHGHVTMPHGWPEAWLNEAPFGHAISTQTPSGGWWSSIGYCQSEDEARRRCCAVMGFAIGRCLARELGEQTLPACTVPGKCTVVF